MEAELRAPGVDVCVGTPAEAIAADRRRVEGVRVGGRMILRPRRGVQRQPADHRAGPGRRRALRAGVRRAGPAMPDEPFEHASLRRPEARRDIRPALRPASVPPRRSFGTEQLLSHRTTSRTYSFYAPRPSAVGSTSAGAEIVVTANARYEDWAGFSTDKYRRRKRELVEDALDALEQYVPGVRRKLDWTEAATPLNLPALYRTPVRFGLRHQIEGMELSRRLPEQVAGCIMRGAWGSSAPAGWGRSTRHDRRPRRRWVPDATIIR